METTIIDHIGLYLYRDYVGILLPAGIAAGQFLMVLQPQQKAAQNYVLGGLRGRFRKPITIKFGIRVPSRPTAIGILRSASG